MKTSALVSPTTLVLLVSCVCVVAAACGSSGDNTFPNGNGDDGGSVNGPNNPDAGFVDFDANFDPDAFWANDPPPKWCGPAGQPPPTPPGGTPECPDDKNREGCPCSNVGATAACWPGLRANRHLGVCKDGQTTCVQTSEGTPHWGPCTGYVLPDPNAKVGKAACKCFSEGQWKLENLVPFFQTFMSAQDAEVATYAISTHQDPVTGAWQPPDSQYLTNPPKLPSEDWTKDTLQVDCAGTFTLCYELKAGDFNHPQSADCSLAKVCVGPFEYPTADAVQQLANLKAWVDADPGKTACADQFHLQGGYGEMSVVGKSYLCESIDDGSGNAFVFNRVQYCKASCSEPDAGADPACATCGQNGSGVFH